MILSINSADVKVLKISFLAHFLSEVIVGLLGLICEYMSIGYIEPLNLSAFVYAGNVVLFCPLLCITQIERVFFKKNLEKISIIQFNNCNFSLISFIPFNVNRVMPIFIFFPIFLSKEIFASHLLEPNESENI